MLCLPYCYTESGPGSEGGVKTVAELEANMGTSSQTNLPDQGQAAGGQDMSAFQSFLSQIVSQPAFLALYLSISMQN